MRQIDMFMETIIEMCKLLQAVNHRKSFMNLTYQCDVLKPSIDWAYVSKIMIDQCPQAEQSLFNILLCNLKRDYKCQLNFEIKILNTCCCLSCSALVSG